MTANVKENVISLNVTSVDGIGVSVSNSGLSVFAFSRDMVFSRFFDVYLH